VGISFVTNNGGNCQRETSYQKKKKPPSFSNNNFLKSHRPYTEPPNTTRFCRGFNVVYYKKILSRTQRTTITKAKGKDLSTTSKQITRQDYVFQKQKHKNKKQKHEMYKTNVKADIYYVNICEHEYVKNMTRLWCKIMLKTNVEQIKGNERSYSYLYPFEDLAQRNLQGGFYVCIR
jgi:hypothetical protein